MVARPPSEERVINRSIVLQADADQRFANTISGVMKARQVAKSPDYVQFGGGKFEERVMVVAVIFVGYLRCCCCCCTGGRGCYC